MCSFYKVNQRETSLWELCLKQTRPQVHQALIIRIIMMCFTIHTAPSDFIPISKDLTFESAQTSQTVEVAIVNDGFAEFTEQFSIVLTSQDENVLIQSGRSTLRVVITDQTGEQMCL